MVERISHKYGLVVAEVIENHLAGTFERLEVAGSLRRGVELVKDVELVGIPKQVTLQPDLFGSSAAGLTRNLLDERVAELRESGKLRPRIGKDGKQAVGSRSKRLWYSDPRLTLAGVVHFDVALDLFSVLDPEHWGATFAIRTGPAAFSRLCVTPRRDGGAMPYGMKQADGKLWTGNTPVPTPTEASWFEAIGIPCWEPDERTEAKIRDYLRGQRL